MPDSSQIRRVKADVNEAISENAGDLSNAMGSGCVSTSQVQGAMSSLDAVTSKVGEIQSMIANSGVFKDNSLQLIYDNTKKINDDALLNQYLAEQNYIMNKREGFKVSEMFKSIRESFTQGENSEYDTLLVNRFTAEANKDLEELNSKNVEVINLLGDLIKVTQQQNIAVDNMQKVMKNLEEKNKQLLSIIYGGKGELYTYNRKSMYESKLKQGVENWTIIPEIAYWTLVVLWVCIVMLYLKNVTFVSVGILIGLILYPYFSTAIYLWVLDKIQSIWNFIFIAVHNRISV
jgi:hypothetical protein